MTCVTTIRSTCFKRSKEDKGYIIHYLIDFGATMGSTSRGPKDARAGNEHYIDYPNVGMNLVGLGVRDPDYMHSKPIKYASVGGFRISNFSPMKWRPTHPHAGLSARTLR